MRCAHAIFAKDGLGLRGGVDGGTLRDCGGSARDPARTIDGSGGGSWVNPWPFLPMGAGC